MNNALSSIYYDNTPLNAFIGDFIYISLILRKLEEQEKLFSLKRGLMNFSFIRYIVLPFVKSLKSANNDLNFDERYLFTWSNIEEYCEKIVLPVAAEFNPDEIAIVGRTNLMRKKIQDGYSFINYRDFFSNFSISDWRSRMRKIKTNIKAEVDSITQKYNLNARFKKNLLIVLFSATQLYDSCQNNFKLSRPKAVITEYDRNFFNSILICSAKRLGIPTYTFIHGTINDKNAYYPFNADTVFCWGDAQKELIKSWGTKSQVIVSGNQKLKIEKYDVEKINRIKIELNIPIEKKIVLFAPNPILLEERKKLLEMFCEASKLNKNKNFCYIVKLHPSDLKDNYMRILKNYPHVRIFDIYEVKFAEMMNMTDIFVVHNSSIGIEAICYGKPVIVMDAVKTPLYNVSELIKNQLAESVETSSGLVLAINESVPENKNNERVDNFISRNIKRFGNDASRFIYNTLKSQTPAINE